MRRFYIRRKDLSHFPFQFYTDRNGVQQRLGRGYTYTLTIQPPKPPFDFLHIHVLAGFAQVAEERWDIAPADMIRVAAKAMAAWLQGAAIPASHFNGTDMLLVDLAWYPQDAEGRPLLEANPYEFEVVTDEAWVTDTFWPKTEATPATVEPSTA
ncbi:MAG: hypothetical protein R3C14_38730 [Caldilineaceae bacterium]